jgi:heme-degrading monooxygenase HmoA
MVARVLEMIVKPDKTADFFHRLNTRALPLLRKQKGFVDQLTMALENEPRMVVGVSLWESPEDAARYQNETYPQIMSMLTPLMETEPVLKVFSLAESATLGRKVA